MTAPFDADKQSSGSSATSKAGAKGRTRAFAIGDSSSREFLGFSALVRIDMAIQGRSATSRLFPSTPRRRRAGAASRCVPCDSAERGRSIIARDEARIDYALEEKRRNTIAFGRAAERINLMRCGVVGSEL